MEPFEASEEFRRALQESARLLHQNRPGEAMSRLLPLHEKLPTHPDVAINLGGAYILQRKWDRAVRVLQLAVEQHPTNAMLWMNLGAAHLGQLEFSGPKQQENAIAAFQRAIQNDPLTPNAHYQLGLIYKERSEWIRASAFFQRALEINPADRDAQYWLNQVSKKMAEFSAKPKIDASIPTNPAPTNDANHDEEA